MPTYVRWGEQGATYFFTVVTYRRQRILTGELSRRILRRVFTSVQRRLPLDLPAFVLLSDHLHCIWSLPDGDDGFPTRRRQIKSLFTREYLALGGRDWDVTERSRGQGRRGVWQPRYREHRIRDRLRDGSGEYYPVRRLNPPHGPRRVSGVVNEVWSYTPLCENKLVFAHTELVSVRYTLGVETHAR